MRYFYWIWVSVSMLVLFGCGPQPSKEVTSTKKPIKTAKPFFEYDEIDYYFNDYDEDKIVSLYNRQSLTILDSIKMGVILGDIPISIGDQKFIALLKKCGYTKTQISPNKFPAINTIFCEKTSENNIATSCVYIFRDILIFKKQHKVIGIAKICFGCYAHRIVGTASNTESFGQNGDYDILWKLLERGQNR